MKKINFREQLPLAFVIGYTSRAMMAEKILLAGPPANSLTQKEREIVAPVTVQSGTLSKSAAEANVGTVGHWRVTRDT
jgi:hypothetical protein